MRLARRRVQFGDERTLISSLFRNIAAGTRIDFAGHGPWQDAGRFSNWLEDRHNDFTGGGRPSLTMHIALANGGAKRAAPIELEICGRSVRSSTMGRVTVDGRCFSGDGRRLRVQ